MKRVFIIGALCCGYAASSHGQALYTYVEELAALQALDKTETQGYQESTDGLGQIGDLRQGEYRLHNDFYTSLGTVNPKILADPRTTELEALLPTLITQLQNELDYWQKQPAIHQP